MIKSLVAIIAVLGAFTARAEFSPTHFNLDEAKKRCQSNPDDSEKVYFNDFQWGYTLLEMEDKFHEIYDSGKRLSYHVQYRPETDKFYLQFESSLKPKRFLEIDANFIASVTRQIEVALEKGFADFVFFPDMGHSHLYFSKDHWDEHYAEFDKNHANQHKLYEKMFADPEMKPLYHLTEQLQMVDEDKVPLDDPILQYKYWNRNFLGKNDQSTHYEIHVAHGASYNTVKNIENHEDWSAGFAVSASNKGCFPYRDKDGKTRYFDISLKDPEYDTSQNSGEPAL